MLRRGFSFVEVAMVIGVLSIVAGFSIPLYRNYQIRNDLAVAKNQITQGLQRAKLNAEAGKNDTDWGFFVPAGVLYRGSSYATRVTASDEIYPMPSSIRASGITQVTYNRSGKPDVTGDIILRDLNGNVASISITIAIDPQTVSVVSGDSFQICKAGQTLLVNDATWPYQQAQGAKMGPCAGSILSSSSSSSLPGGTGASSLCSQTFTVATDGMITFTSNVYVTFKNLLSQITYGAGGPPVNVAACRSDTTPVTSYRYLFHSNGNCNSAGVPSGQTVPNTPSGVYPPASQPTDTASYNAGNKLAVRVKGRYQLQGWLAFDESYTSNDQTGHMLWLKNGDTPANLPGFGNQTGLQTFLDRQGYLDAQKKLNISNCELLGITELGPLSQPSADFQDNVMLLTVTDAAATP